jgi:hypothetical protein
MNTEMKDLSKQLQSELAFLEQGGYSRSPGTLWRTPLIFEDSRICTRNTHPPNDQSCSSCVLIQLVPPDHRLDKVPCRHIPFNSEGETLDSLYRYADGHEIEVAYANWLRSTIQRLEQQPEVDGDIDLHSPAPSGKCHAKGNPTTQGCRANCVHSTCRTRQFGSETHSTGSFRVDIPSLARRKAFPI